jgi:hypothetical protein
MLLYICRLLLYVYSYTTIYECRGGIPRIRDAMLRSRPLLHVSSCTTTCVSSCSTRQQRRTLTDCTLTASTCDSSPTTTCVSSCSTRQQRRTHADSLRLRSPPTHTATYVSSYTAIYPHILLLDSGRVRCQPPIARPPHMLLYVCPHILLHVSS